MHEEPVKPETAKTYTCPVCTKPIFSQDEGEDHPSAIECWPDRHVLRWRR